MLRVLTRICLLLLALFGGIHECLCATPNIGFQHLDQIWNEEFGHKQTNDQPVNLFQHRNQQSSLPHTKSEPHPAVARIIVAEQGATSYGSGTLIDIRENYGLVITNWHVVRDAQGPVEVLFPNGFRSQARALKVDAEWDLAALVIWKPEMQPVKIATAPPQPGDQLTICGYGQGMYRAATGRCTDYYAPRPDLPRQMVELDVEARQGDSGGPIFNSQGELAGVLFGAGQGTTLGSFGGRVENFLASLAPDIGKNADNAPQVAQGSKNIMPNLAQETQVAAQADVQNQIATESETRENPFTATTPTEDSFVADNLSEEEAWSSSWPDSEIREQQFPIESQGWQAVPPNSMFEQVKTALAAVGLLAIAVQVLRAAR